MVTDDMQRQQPNMRRTVMKCSECRGLFVSFGTDEEAMPECIEHFGPCRREDLSVVCPGCWEDIKRRMYGRSL